MLILNTNMKAGNATTQYYGFDFNSMAKAHGDYYVASEDGLFKMDGEQDNGSNISSINTEKVSAITYPITIAASGQQDVRITISRALHGRFWTFKVSNGSSGADFSIDEMRVLPLFRNRYH